MLLLQTLELKSAAGPSNQETADQSLSDGLSVDLLMAGFTGAILGFIASMVGGALGSSWGYSGLSSLALLLTALFLGCFAARREFRRGDFRLAEFMLATLQAGALAGFGSALGLACASLVVMQLAIVTGIAAPSLIARLPASNQI